MPKGTRISICNFIRWHLCFWDTLVSETIEYSSALHSREVTTGYLCFDTYCILKIVRFYTFNTIRFGNWFWVSWCVWGCSSFCRIKSNGEMHDVKSSFIITLRLWLRQSNIAPPSLVERTQWHIPVFGRTRTLQYWIPTGRNTKASLDVTVTVTVEESICKMEEIISLSATVPFSFKRSSGLKDLLLHTG